MENKRNSVSRIRTTDIVYCGMFASRMAVGAFIKTYPVYADFSNDEPVDKFLQKLDEHISLNRENDLYAFADFREDMKLDASVLFAYQGDIIPPMDFCGCESEIVLMPMKDAKAAFGLWKNHSDSENVPEYVSSMRRGGRLDCRHLRKI